MDNQMKWINRNLLLGRTLLAAGLVIGVAGVLLPYFLPDVQFNTRIVTGIGILMLGLGIVYLNRHNVLRRDTLSARRMISEERDERTQLYRARAGSRAYWVSTAMSYILLMWVSFAESGSLPALNSDALWYFLAAVVVVPFGMYTASLLYDQKVH